MTGPGTPADSDCRFFDTDFDEDVDARDFAAFQAAFTGAGGDLPAVIIVYDCNDRMVEFSDAGNGQRHTYAYDALGRRIVKVVDADGVGDGPLETRFFYDGWQVVEEQDDNGVTRATYVYGLYIDDVIDMQRGGEQY